MKKSAKAKPAKRSHTPFGGRPAANGPGYEAEIAAHIAVQMLAGDACIVWDGINGSDIESITMQDASSVDDVVVTLRGEFQPKIFISAKHRKGSISLTKNSPAFTEVVYSFVRQFHQLALPQRAECRLQWAVPSSAGAGMKRYLREVLNDFRADGSENTSEFLHRRTTKEKEAMKALISDTKRYWKKVTERAPDELELSDFLRMVYIEVYDFGLDLHHERNAEETIRRSLAAKPADSKKIWEKLELHFNHANRKGLLTTAASLRRNLTSWNLKLKPSFGFTADLEFLRRLTERNIEKLEEHTLLRFSQGNIHIARTEELSAITAAAKRGHLLITGEPGCGKSGLIQLVGRTLIQEGTPVVLLLAEEVFGRDTETKATLPGLDHALDDVLLHWADGSQGVLITDALDAVRDLDTQNLLRRLLQNVQRGSSGWSVVASVREFDLKFGHKLREAFPGEGVAGHSSKEFTGVSHFHVARLPESCLDELATDVPEVAPFIRNARKNPRAADIHRSPFFLKLAADLLRSGVPANRVADWSSPAILLRSFWQKQLLDDAGAAERISALRTLCSKMTELRSMNLAIQEVTLTSSDLRAIADLRSRGILQSPILRYGNLAGEDHLRFSHHVLHDYAIARSLIPTVADRFSEFALSSPLMPVFYRQSFIFALEELWDGPDGPKGFWTCALKMEDAAQLHGITRTLAPLLAAKRVNEFPDLHPLFEAVKTSKDGNSPAHKALRNLAAGLQDADDSAIRMGVAAWCSLIVKLGELLPNCPPLEGPLVNMLGRLNAICVSFPTEQQAALNLAARSVLASHVAKEVNKGSRYSARITIEALCRTFLVAPAETESSLLSLLTPERLAGFPCWDLFDFAHQLHHLCREGDRVVLRLFEAAFATEPSPGEWEDYGGAIMSMRMQSSDNWNSIHFSLGGYYITRDGSAPDLMTDIACIAWNAAMRRRSGRRGAEAIVVANFSFRSLNYNLVEDRGHSWNRTYEHDENRILSHFEILLDRWAAASDLKSLGIALDCLATRNRTSIMWTVFMEAGAKHTTTLGKELEPALQETLFFTHPDYSYGGISLFSALHKTGDTEQRKRLESIILSLPKTARFLRDEPREPTPHWLLHAQNKLLGSLDDANIVRSEVQALRKQRSASASLPKNRLRVWPEFTFSTSEDGFSDNRDITQKDPVIPKLLLLIEGLKTFRDQKDDSPNVDTLENNWPFIKKTESALRYYRSSKSEMIAETWGYLVGACERIARYATWLPSDKRWKTVRRILLKASTDPQPEASQNDEDMKEDRLPSGIWPAPRVDAANGLFHLMWRLGRVDASVKKAVMRLCRDKLPGIRFDIGGRIAILKAISCELMWSLFDSFIRHEQKFSVLEVVVISLENLFATFPAEVLARLSRIAKRARTNAPAQHDIHGYLAHAYLFRFLRTNDSECESYIEDLINHCDTFSASNALGAQLHTCRAGGWLTAGDAVSLDEHIEALRKRTWSFFQRLLMTAQTKLRQHQARWRQLHSMAKAEEEDVKLVRDAIESTTRLIDGIAMQLYFASGAFADKQNTEEDRLQEPRKKRFWVESSGIFRALATELHPHTIHHVVETLYYLLPCAPRDIFLVAMNAIISSSAVGYQHESMAVTAMVNIIQRALADHREIFKPNLSGESECLSAMLQVLDIFVEAGWKEARQLTHRLEEIYR